MVSAKSRLCLQNELVFPFTSFRDYDDLIYSFIDVVYCICDTSVAKSQWHKGKTLMMNIDCVVQGSCAFSASPFLLLIS